MRIVCFLILSLIFSLSCRGVERNYYNNIKLDNDTTFFDIDTNSDEFAIEVRASVVSNKDCRGEANASWSVIWGYESQINYNFVRIKWGNTDYGDFLDRRYVRLIIGRIENGNEFIYSSRCYESGFNLGVGENSILIQSKDNEISVYAGNDKLKLIETIGVNVPVGKCGVASVGETQIAMVVIETEQDKASALHTIWTIDSINDYLSSSTDPIEGYWKYLDRDNNPEWAKLGGNYTIALVKEDNGYLILYIDGAIVNQGNWQQFMLKGILKKTIFKNHFDLVWYDAMCDAIDYEIYAEISHNAILTLSFPLYKTSVRFSKIPKN